MRIFPTRIKLILIIPLWFHWGNPLCRFESTDALLHMSCVECWPGRLPNGETNSGNYPEKTYAN